MIRLFGFQENILQCPWAVQTKETIYLSLELEENIALKDSESLLASIWHGERDMFNFVFAISPEDISS